MIALTGHFASGHDLDCMLAHIGMISALHEVRYWSVTDKQWNALFTRAIGLSGPDSSTPRGDFSSAEFRKGSELCFLSSDNRLQSEIVTRLRVMDMEAESVIFETTNVSSLRWLTFTMVPAGDMQTLYFLNRRPDGSWQFYSLTRVLNGSVLLPLLVSNPSYVNRAVAMYRYIAGIKTDSPHPRCLESVTSCCPFQALRREAKINPRPAITAAMPAMVGIGRLCCSSERTWRGPISTTFLVSVKLTFWTRSPTIPRATKTTPMTIRLRMY
jgi:uncharacterized protein DUF6675